MGFEPRGGRGGFGGRGGDRGGRGGFRGGFGGGRGGFQQGPPAAVVEVATFSHSCEGELIGMVDGNRVPLLARMIYNANKQMIGKVEDVFGPMHSPGICIKADTNSGVKAESFKSGDKVSVPPISLMTVDGTRRLVLPSPSHPRRHASRLRSDAMGSGVRRWLPCPFESNIPTVITEWTACFTIDRVLTVYRSCTLTPSSSETRPSSCPDPFSPRREAPWDSKASSPEVAVIAVAVDSVAEIAVVSVVATEAASVVDSAEEIAVVSVEATEVASVAVIAVDSEAAIAEDSVDAEATETLE